MINNLISVIIPTYKEAENIPILVKKIDESLLDRYKYEIIIVDDNSKDGIVENVADLQQKNYNVNLKIRINEKGLSSAVIEGLKVSTGNICLVMDADLSHPPEKIPELIDEIVNNNAEFVIGSRFIEGGGSKHFNTYRKLNAWFSKLLACPFSKATDPMAGFFAFPKYILENKLDTLNPVGFKIGLEIYVKCSPKNLKEIPIQFQERLHGESKLNLTEQIKYIIHLWRLFEFKFQSISEFIKFGCVGASGAVINLFCVFIFYDLIGIYYSIAIIIAFMVALTSNFNLNRIFTFKAAEHCNIFKQYIKFFMTCLLGFVVYWIVSYSLFKSNDFLHKYYLIPNFIGIICGLIFNFIGSKLFVFKNDSSK